MGKTRNWEKKQEGQARKQRQLEEKKRLEEEVKNKKLDEYWAEGAKDDTKDKIREEKRKAVLEARARRKAIYEAEFGPEK